ncbi:putative glycoside hydrolase [Bacillus sp. V59.32b]|uniref:putative glycoside hydrolase n=1 Tax=Bacillus sp. V59.32b TaxID=1758642 RepID=UPI000E3BFDD9|nr:putative glycoside hydrolase [Bacillus sp. V59.32b]RFU63049.1 GTP-binding protein [Bacillus sp. V59.32b]
MNVFKKWAITGIAIASVFPAYGYSVQAEETNTATEHHKYQVALSTKNIPEGIPRFVYDSGLTFTYPDAVRGIYVTGHSAGGENFNRLVQLLDKTDLNSMVIDIKDDWGNVTYRPEDPNSPYAGIGKNYIKKPVEMLKELEKKEIYPIARIVVFKDSLLPKERPELSYMDGNAVWKNGRDESFVNPFLKEVWDYNVGIAIEAAKMGFQEIQFDYVRFPEGFEKRDSTLKYSMGEYEDLKMDNTQKRVQAVTDFVAYAREKLQPYGVKVSVDIFGYSATLPEAPGIGQNFSKISENVDVISSMIYPSHWTSYFGIAKPDLEPYKVVAEYAKLENQKLTELKTPPISRPWLQDFTASYLGSGNYKKYGKAEVEAQIKALKDNGINEYLLWNAGNHYTQNVDFTP